MSSSPSVEQRIQDTCSIPGVDAHADKNLKSFIQNFLWGRGIGCSIERVKHETSHSTTILFESKSGKVYSTIPDLISALETMFPNITVPSYDHWIPKHSECTLTAATIKPTYFTLRRTEFSGENSFEKGTSNSPCLV